MTNPSALTVTPVGPYIPKTCIDPSDRNLKIIFWPLWANEPTGKISMMAKNNADVFFIRFSFIFCNPIDGWGMSKRILKIKLLQKLTGLLLDSFHL